MKVVIIGGYGKMGRWLARALRAEAGLEVIIAGRDGAKLREAAQQLGVRAAPALEAVENADAVILSLPIDSFEAICRELAPAVRHGQYIFDVTSVKVRPVEIMHKYFGGCRILGTHPMFGPGATSVSGHRVVLTPTSAGERSLAGTIHRYLEERGASVAIMSPDEHDELMSIVLGLSHFIALVSADTLLSLGKLEGAEAVGGTSYRLLLTLAEAVASEEPEFYAALHMSLPGLAAIESIFLSKAGGWADLVKNKDEQGFVIKMRGLANKFRQEDPGFADAYHNAYKLLGEG